MRWSGIIPTWKTRRGRVLLIVAVGGLIAAGVTVEWVSEGNYPAHNFGVVRPGVMYRSGQPEDEAAWRALENQSHIRTVIDLREDMPQEKWAIVERDFCVRYGIRHVKLPIDTAGPTPEQFKQFLDIANDPSCWPILVHCQLGKSRTGVMVAAYRMLVQGWSRQDAMADAEKYKDHMDPGYVAFLETLARDGGGNEASSACSAPTQPIHERPLDGAETKRPVPPATASP